MKKERSGAGGLEVETTTIGVLAADAKDFFGVAGVVGSFDVLEFLTFVILESHSLRSLPLPVSGELAALFFFSISTEIADMLILFNLPCIKEYVLPKDGPPP
jgi:hypothetical protein